MAARYHSASAWGGLAPRIALVSTTPSKPDLKPSARHADAMPREPRKQTSEQNMKLATWNVNSLNVRLQQVLDWLAANPVDVLCIQELKLTSLQGSRLPRCVGRPENLQRRRHHFPRARHDDGAQHPRL